MRPADRLHRVLAPQRIALIGAKDSGRLFMGTGAVLQALERMGFGGELHLVNRGGVPVYGRTASTSLAQTGAEIDHAAVLTPAAAIPDVLPDALAAGAAGATLLASGLAETGAAGAELQQRIASLARGAGAELIGPNCLGFLNLVERTGVWFSGYPEALATGPVAVVSQSGGVGDAIMEAAVEFGIGLSHVITTGNEPTLAVSNVLEYLVEQPAVRSVAVFAEAIRDPEALVRAAARARELRKTIVMLKGGASALGARNAVTHTGSLAGDDVIADAAMRQLGIVRATSLEELLVSAHLAATLGPLRSPGVGVVALSGGGAGLIADAAERVGLSLPDYTPSTTESLRGVVGDFATVQNPFDVTAAVGDSTFQDVLGVVAQQPDIGAIAVLCNVPTHESGATPDVARLLRSIGAGMASVPVPAVLVGQTAAHARSFGIGIARDAGVGTVLPGIELAAAALGNLARWSAWLAEPASAVLRGLIPGEQTSGMSLSEWDSRIRLAEHAVPLVDGELVSHAADAVTAWRRFGGPVAVKGVSAQLAHKSDAGAVVLGVDDEAAVTAAFDTVATAVRATGSELQGVLVAPMTSGEVELIVGVHRDPVWGRALVVGLGGVLVEVLRDAATIVLPAERRELDLLLDRLRAGALLRGVRGRRGVDRDALLDAIEAIARAGIQPDVVSLEVNPLLAGADRVVGLDALVVAEDAS